MLMPTLLSRLSAVEPSDSLVVDVVLRFRLRLLFSRLVLVSFSAATCALALPGPTPSRHATLQPLDWVSQSGSGRTPTLIASGSRARHYGPPPDASTSSRTCQTDVNFTHSRERAVVSNVKTLSGFPAEFVPTAIR